MAERTETATALAGEVRLAAYRQFRDRGHPPTTTELAADMGLERGVVLDALRELAAGRALILSATEERVVVAPPFSSYPTPFWVETGSGAFWGNCAWEALGVAALLGGDARVVTTSGAGARPLEVRIEGGEPMGEALMHIPIPARRWWEDVRFTCANVLFFGTEDEVDDHCARHGVPRGEVLGLAGAWTLAKRWFTGRFEEDWRRLTVDEAHASFADAGLHGAFWNLEEGS